MLISEERQNHLAQLITDGLWNDDLVDYEDDDRAFRAAKKGIFLFVQEDEDIYEKACSMVHSLKRNVVEGSSEWDVLVKKYYEQELNRRG